MLDSLIGKIVYYGYSNGMCYSGELELETFKNNNQYVIKRAIPIQFPNVEYPTSMYIDEKRIDKIVGPNIFIKQEKDREIENPIVDSSIPAPF